jgi:hypothetical protein|tara:strand:+ start:34 stop:3933 length:3900 start_codon:yes stop_codon:yes gene_type:complete
MSVFNLHQGVVAGTAAAGGGAVFDTTLIGNSIWLEGAGTSGDAMTRTWGSQSNQDRWIWATWFQPLRLADATGTRSVLFGTGSGSHGFYLRHNSTASTFNVFHRDNAGNEGAINTTESYRDLTAWIHVLVDYDSANSLSDNRISLYINGVRTGINSGTRPAQNNDLQVNVSGQTAHIGQDISTTPNYHTKGYLAQTIFLDNKSIANGDLAITDFLDTFTFGTNGSQIIPKADADIIALASAAGNNSFCLDYSDASNIVNDASTKTNHFTAVSSSITSANQSAHTPSKVYATWNALDSANDGHTTDMTISDGGTVTEDGNGAFCRSTFAIPEGLFSYRVTVDDSTSNQMFGVALDTALDRGNGNTNHPGQYAVNAGGGDKNTNGTGSSQYSAWSDGDTMEVYVSRSGTTYKVWYGKNGTLLNGASGSQGDPSAGSNELFSFTHTGDVFFSADYTNAGTKKATTDFGQKGYSPAEGALTLSSPNIPAPTYQGIDYFDATLYEGNGNGQRVGDFVPFTDAYTVTNSALFNDDDTRILSKTFGGSGDRRTMTFSTWAKWTNPAGSGQIIFSSGTSLSDRFEIEFASADNITIFSKVSNSTILNLGSTIDLADTSQWVNIVVSIDTDQASTAERYRLFVNGVQQTLTVTTDSLTSGDGSADSGDQLHLNSAIQHNIGGRDGGLSAAYFDGYLAETVFIDGARLDASSFGQVDTSTNRWVPKSVSGLTFGTNGFYLEYKVATGTENGVGTDSAGSNHFAEEGSWATTDKVTDTPSENFCTWDPGRKDGNTLSEGNLKVTSDGNNDWDSVIGTTFISSGKYYWEIERDTATGIGDSFRVGVVLDSFPPATTLQSTNHAYLLSENGGRVAGRQSLALTSDYGVSTTAGDFIGVALDMDRNAIYFSKNGTWMNSASASGIAAGTDYSKAAFSDVIGRVAPFLQMYGSQAGTLRTNSDNWEGTAPTGFLELNQDNLDATASKITAWAWIRGRDSNDTYNHMLYDRVRGVGESLDLFSNSTVAEVTEPNTVQRFLQRGVQVGNDTQVNAAAESYVMWQWLVGSSSGTTTPSGGSIASTVAAADTGHFSVGTFTGAGGSSTIAHGLSGEPEFFLVKRVGSSGTGWFIYSKDTTDPNNKFLRLQTTAAEDSASGAWTPGATTMGLNESSLNGINTSGVEHLFIAFRSVPGVCKVGKFVGNGSHDGPYLSMGFTPAWYMQKDITTTSGWYIFDFRRPGFNATNSNHFLANTFAQEGIGAFHEKDFLADGMKLNGDNADTNASNSTFIYLAMADIAGNGTLPPIYGRGPSNLGY